MKKWDSKYSVKVEVLDDQHKELFRLVNELSGAVENGEEIDKNYTMARLEVYSLYHFTSEEHLMQKYNYPQIKEHLHEHNKFRVQILKFKDQFLSGEAKDDRVAGQVIEYLEDWIANHILETDKKYSPCLTGKKSA